MADAALHWPAEWHPQAAVLIAWPHAGTDWAEHLVEVERTYVCLAAAVTRFEPLIVCVPDDEVRRHAERLLEHGTGPFPIRFVEVPYDDTWLRDSGPITLLGEPHRCVLDDFRFTGWGGKFDAAQDDALIENLFKRNLFPDAEHRPIDWALEGGAVESDGRGGILSTWQCLHLRHPGQSRAEIERMLCDCLAGERVLWLEHGHLEGDDTDAHIDTLARFAPDDTLVYQACDDHGDSHHEALSRMADELAALRTALGDPYTLRALPWPAPIRENGRRLAASYANYLVINDAVLVPAYGDPADTRAAAIVGLAHPHREVVQIPCRPLIRQNGSLHCITMQLPAGVLQ